MESDLSSEPARLASRSLLIALARAGNRLVAVGDRGNILLSDDQGRSWAQVVVVPTQALLTGICFSDAQHGIAVGHDEVVLTTQDAGQHWTRTHYAPQAQQPLLDVWCGEQGRAIAVGAYSTYLTSGDGGASWSERKFEAQPLSKAAGAAGRGAGAGGKAGMDVSSRTGGAAGADADDAALGGGYHLNRIVGQSGAALGPAEGQPAGASQSRLYIAAEAGHLYRSDDGGASWLELPSPYEGSFFGVLPLSGDALLAYGLRGNLFRSEDAGASWRRLESGTVALLDGGVRVGENSVSLVGLSGVVLVSHDGGQSFALLQQDDRKGLSAVVAVGAESLVTAGEAGAKRISLAKPAEGFTDPATIASFSGPRRITAQVQSRSRP